MIEVRRSAAIGFTVKSGWACAVLLADSPGGPRVLDSCKVELSDPSVTDSRQPYHAGFGTARKKGPKLARLLASVRRFGSRSVATAIRRYRNTTPGIRGAGIIVGSLIDPNQIANDHIRIHALEGQLFRRVVEQAAARSRLRASTWRERDLYPLAVKRLKKSGARLRTALAGLGRDVGGPWRAEQKAAALAAWLVLDW